MNSPDLAHARTLLFVPGHQPERFDKAWASGADALVLDLEDAVAPQAKAAARQAVAEALRAWPAARADRTVVRINGADTAWWPADLALLAGLPAGGVMVPKAESAAVLAEVAAACPGARLLPLVETARGLLAAERLCEAPRVLRLVFGTIDFALDMDLSGDPLGLDAAAARLAWASRAAGLAPPVAGVTVALDDPAQLRADLVRARAHGFGGKLCIHPRQVAPLHAALQPDAAALDQARRIVAAADAAAGAAVQLDGRMIDRPVVERARRLLARAA